MDYLYFSFTSLYLYTDIPHCLYPGILVQLSELKQCRMNKFYTECILFYENYGAISIEADVTQNKTFQKIHSCNPPAPSECTWNQSMVQQLMREGNILSRLRKASPMGLIASTMCRLVFTRSMKKLYIARGVPSTFLP